MNKIRNLTVIAISSLTLITILLVANNAMSINQICERTSSQYSIAIGC